MSKNSKQQCGIGTRMLSLATQMVDVSSIKTLKGRSQVNSVIKLADYKCGYEDLLHRLYKDLKVIARYKIELKAVQLTRDLNSNKV